MKRSYWPSLVGLMVCVIIYFPGPSHAGLPEADAAMLAGRAYRLNFPVIFWDDIAGTYEGQKYNHFSFFEAAHLEYTALLNDPTAWPVARIGLAAAVNEMIMGQEVFGNDILMDTLSRRFPECESGGVPVDCALLPPGQRPTSPQTPRDEAPQLDQSILNLSLGVQIGLQTLHDHPEVLSAEGGPFVSPLYKVCVPYGASPAEDPCYPASGDVPIRNEFAQLSQALEKELYSRVEKSARLFRYATADPTKPQAEVLEEVRADAKAASAKGYLVSAILAAAQPGMEEFQQNDGAKIKPQLQRARELTWMIDTGLTPFANSGLYIPNETVSRLETMTEDAIQDALAAEIEARDMQMDYDRDLADLKQELSDLRVDYTTQLYLLTGMTPDEYYSPDPAGGAAMVLHGGTMDTEAEYNAYFAEFDRRLREFFPSSGDIESKLWRGDTEELGQTAEGAGTTTETQVTFTGPPDSGEEVEVYVLDADTAWNLDSGSVFDADFLPKPDHLGEIGLQVYNLYNAYLDMMRITREMNNVVEQIMIEWARRDLTVDRLQNDWDFISTMNWAKLPTYLIPTISVGTDTSAEWDAGGAVRQILDNVIAEVQHSQQVYLTQVESDATIANLSLEIGVKALELRQAQDRYNQENGKLLTMIGQAQRCARDLSAKESAAVESVIWTDPSYRLLLATKQRRAQAELDYAVTMLYKLGKTLEYQWAEGFQNPVVGPILCDGQLPNVLWDNFTELDDVYAVLSAYEADDFLDAFKAWDLKLREDCGGVSMRGPNHNGPFTRMISMRREMLDLEYLGVDPPFAEEDSRIAFQDFVAQHLVYNPRNPGLPSFEYQFPLSIIDNKYFSLNSWNVKIDDRNPYDGWYPPGVGVAYIAESGFQPNYDPVVRTQLQHGGRATIRTYWADPYAGQDDFVFYAIQGTERPERSIYTATMLSMVNDETGIHGPGEFWSSQLAGRSPATTKWKLVIDSSEYENRNIDFTKLEDIIIYFVYSEGNPPCLLDCGP